ncbi:MAG: DUF362 domain-containing protein [Candidatus Aenigmarchaeota archaeon]|nr:DUF362 domain-containing protein [Candidatus Aenigmarchaeota archaeon]
MSLVYFYKDVNNIKTGVNNFFERIAKEMGSSTATVGLKIHFGEEKNTTYINPEWLKDVKKFFSDPVFIECNVLYRGRRTFTDDHIAVAKEHGFGFIEIDILNGKKGEETVEIPINIGLTKNAKIGRGIEKYRSIVVLSHFKGHIISGFGGAIKNIGMGLGSRPGKLDMHSSVMPVIDAEKCRGCALCKENCNVHAIDMEKGKAVISKEKCIGCAMCIAVCPRKAVRVPFGNDTSERLMEKMAEYAAAAVKGRCMWYINFLTDMTYRCDCVKRKQKPFMKDIGIVFSRDPVAIDTASLELVEKNFGKDPFKAHNHRNGKHILEYSEKIGLGTMDYELREV